MRTDGSADASPPNGSPVAGADWIAGADWLAGTDWLAGAWRGTGTWSGRPFEAESAWERLPGGALLGRLTSRRQPPAEADDGERQDDRSGTTEVRRESVVVHVLGGTVRALVLPERGDAQEFAVAASDERIVLSFTPPHGSDLPPQRWTIVRGSGGTRYRERFEIAGRGGWTASVECDYARRPAEVAG